ncbi:MAG: hypothetical protein M3680_10025 [Myxococcota bacterium]|nr:hypothetical protein [Myxococcota bacterium]
MMRIKTLWGWQTKWNFNKNIPYTGSFNLGGRQVSLAGTSEIYVEATVCWKLAIRHCRSDNATLKLIL